MKITIYELLGLIKDNKTPNLIKYKDLIYFWDDEYQDYVSDNLFILDFVCIKVPLQEYLNDTLEIIESKGK